MSSNAAFSGKNGTDQLDQQRITFKTADSHHIVALHAKNAAKGGANHRRRLRLDAGAFDRRLRARLLHAGEQGVHSTEPIDNAGPKPAFKVSA